ncbi:hypothetical protein [Sphingomonas sp. PP-CE-3A-406]|nr:hypothetical protein [Sphingomonas sp. PP-CE-3A-406]
MRLEPLPHVGGNPAAASTSAHLSYLVLTQGVKRWYIARFEAWL